jgi:hypothetical protein
MICRARRIKIDNEKECKLEVFTDRLQLSDGTWTKTLPVGSIVRILYRGMLDRPYGIEIFVEMAPSVLLAFDDGKCFGNPTCDRWVACVAVHSDSNRAIAEVFPNH